jgi:hypothetical protein
MREAVSGVLSECCAVLGVLNSYRSRYEEDERFLSVRGACVAIEVIGATIVAAQK